jgi:hypothetical protein
MLQNTEWGDKKKGQSRESRNTGHTRRRKNKTKTQHNMHLTSPYANKTYVPSQTTGGKGEPSIVFMKEDYHQQLILKGLSISTVASFSFMMLISSSFSTCSFLPSICFYLILLLPL